MQIQSMDGFATHMSSLDFLSAFDNTDPPLAIGVKRRERARFPLWTIVDVMAPEGIVSPLRVNNAILHHLIPLALQPSARAPVSLCAVCVQYNELTGVFSLAREG